MSWVRTRMTLDQDLMEWIRHGFALITVGFGSFAFLEGVVGAFGETERPPATEPSRIFSLSASAVGVTLIASALRHNRNMVEFVNADAFGDQEAPALPDEKRAEYLAMGAIVIGLVSFVALLLLR
jgi:hypothetical protein